MTGAAPRRALLVEDNEDHALLARAALEREGWQVEVAACGEAALERLRAVAYGVLVLDHWLPDMTGLEALGALRLAGHDLPVVVLTAVDSATLAVASVKAGAHEYLPKAGDFAAALPGAVERAVCQHAEAAEKERLRAALAARNDELAALVERLRELDRLKVDFMAMITHELRSPIAAIEGYATLLLQHGPRIAAAQRELMVATIQREASHLARLVADALDVARMDADRFSYDFRPFDLLTLVREAVTQAQGKSARHTITLCGPEAVVVVWGDALRLRQVLDNLLENAIKYSPDGGPVEVAVREDPARGEAEVSVRDHGIGIPPEHQAQVFE
ncbi:MAG: response regulator, partial [Chloroflexi bacterium]|nr:response regulator [Chloroflexota bacterium]